MPTFVLTTDDPKTLASLHPKANVVFEAEAFRIYEIENPGIALRQWENAADVINRDVKEELVSELKRAAKTQEG